MSFAILAFQQAVKAAGKISLSGQQKVEIAVDKGEGDYATSSDLDAGKAMENILAQQLSQYKIVPEENKTDLSEQDFRQQRQAILDSGTFILMDDLDATVRYRHGGEDYGHMLGLVLNHKLTTSVMYMPRRNIMVTAELGRGCDVNDIVQEELDQALTINDSLLCLTIHKDLHPSFHTEVPTKIIYTTKPSGYTCFNSNIGGLTRLIEGELGGFLGCGHNWDFIGALAVQEAGGFIASADGEPLNWSRIPQVIIAAANEEIGQTMLGISKLYAGYDEHFWNNPKFQS